jgi:hypothetical protein
MGSLILVLLSVQVADTGGCLGHQLSNPRSFLPGPLFPCPEFPHFVINIDFRPLH